MRYQPFEMHCHTRHSDGSFTVPGLLEGAAAYGYAGLALTDHNAVSALREVTPELEARTRRMQLQKLVHAGVHTLVNAKVLQIGDGFVEYESFGLTERVSDVKEVVMAAGYRGSVQNELKEACDTLQIPMYSVGDVNRARTEQ